MKQMSRLARKFFLSTLMAAAITLPAIVTQAAPVPRIRTDVPVAGNESLLPGAKVNSGALGRIVQLVQEGYVMIQP
ncbi:MAG: hypothetical protein ACYCTW_03585 [Sulfuricella sp.]